MCRLQQKMIAIPLEGFLLTPVQKICKYPLQLRELLCYTWRSHPDFKHLTTAADAMRDITSLVNERKRKMDSMEKLIEWQRSVAQWQVRLCFTMVCWSVCRPDKRPTVWDVHDFLVFLLAPYPQINAHNGQHKLNQRRKKEYVKRIGRPAMEIVSLEMTTKRVGDGTYLKSWRDRVSDFRTCKAVTESSLKIQPHHESVAELPSDICDPFLASLYMTVVNDQWNWSMKLMHRVTTLCLEFYQNRSSGFRAVGVEICSFHWFSRYPIDL